MSYDPLCNHFFVPFETTDSEQAQAIIDHGFRVEDQTDVLSEYVKKLNDDFIKSQGIILINE